MSDQKKYEMIGDDDEQYGPFTLQELKEAVSQNRANSQTKIRETGSEEWHPLSQLIGTGTNSTPDQASESLGAAITSHEPLDMNKALSDGWALLKEHFGIMIGAGAILFGIMAAVGVLGAIIPGVQIFVQGPLTGGFIILTLKLSRHGQAQIEDLFLGFKNYGWLLLAPLVQGAIVFASMLPGIILLIIGAVSMGNENQELGIAMFVAAGLISLILVSIALILTYFLVHLVADKRGTFGDAVSAAYIGGKMNFWSLLGMMIILGLGSCLIIIPTCGLGTFFVIPWVNAVFAKAYEQIFPISSTTSESQYLEKQ